MESSCIAYDSHGVVKCASPSRNYCLSIWTATVTAILAASRVIDKERV
ncbi:hypothetical protein [Priestia megaterium]